jgi:hypothetical protein
MGAKGQHTSQTPLAQVYNSDNVTTYQHYHLCSQPRYLLLGSWHQLGTGDHQAVLGMKLRREPGTNTIGHARTWYKPNYDKCATWQKYAWVPINTQYKEMPKHATLHYNVILHFISCFLTEATCKKVTFKLRKTSLTLEFFHVPQWVLCAKLTLDTNWLLIGCWYMVIEDSSTTSIK